MTAFMSPIGALLLILITVLAVAALIVLVVLAWVGLRFLIALFQFLRHQ